MPRYRLLSMDELYELEKEFIEYLILNGIAAEDWVKIKENEPGKAENIIDLFSDVVFESIMRKTHFLEKRDRKKIEVLQCLKDKFVLVGLDASEVADADLTSSVYIQNAIQLPPSNLSAFSREIPYQELREKELFDKTQRGFVISDGTLFKRLCMVLPKDRIYYFP